MKLIIYLLCFLIVVVALAGCFFFSRGPAEPPMDNIKSFYDLSAESMNGQVVKMSDYKGKVLLVVNTASKCGFTSQYKELEMIYKKYNSLGFEVLGFPSNDFHKQEPGSNKEIMQFCERSFGVTFPMFEKVVVTGPEKSDVFGYLTRNGADDFRGPVAWNFEKFLIDRKGEIRGRWGSFSTPDSSSITEQIEKLLAEK